MILLVLSLSHICNSSHTIDHIASSLSSAVDVVVSAIDCVDVADFEYTPQWRQFVPFNQSSIQFIRSNKPSHMSLTMNVFTTLMSRALLVFVQQCSVNVVYITGPPCVEYHSLSNRCKVCWLHNYKWDNDGLEHCVLHDSIDVVERLYRQGDTNICSYDSSCPLTIPAQSVCYIIDFSNNKSVDVISDRAIMALHTADTMSTIAPTVCEFSYNTQCVTDIESTMQQIMSCFYSVPDCDLFITILQSLETYMYCEFNTTQIY